MMSGSTCFPGGGRRAGVMQEQDEWHELGRPGGGRAGNGV